MSQRRTLILVAAIAIGALASFLVWNYVNNVEDTALSDAAQVPVYLVKQTVPKGTPGLQAQAYIAKENIPRKFKPANAITDIADISGKVAVNDLVPNQVVVSDMFVDASDPSAQSSFAERLNRIRNTDQTAITITVDQVRGVAGLIQPGDYVNMMLVPPSSSAKTSQSGTAVPAGARYLFQKIEVLAVGQEALPQAGAATAASTGSTPAVAESNNAGLLTLIVPTQAAQYIASVDPSSIYLTLVAQDYKAVPQVTLDGNAGSPAEDPTKLTPYGPKGPESGN